MQPTWHHYGVYRRAVMVVWLVCAFVLLPGLPAGVLAQDAQRGAAASAAVTQTENGEDSPSDRAWRRFSELYRNADSRVIQGLGNRFDEIYVGANCFFDEHRLKVQSGLHWGDMDDTAADGGDYSGVSWVSGIRVSW